MIRRLLETTHVGRPEVTLTADWDSKTNEFVVVVSEGDRSVVGRISVNFEPIWGLDVSDREAILTEADRLVESLGDDSGSTASR